MSTEWREVQNELPDPFIDVFVMNSGKIGIAYYNPNYEEFFSTSEVLLAVSHWTPIVYPDLPKDF